MSQNLFKGEAIVGISSANLYKTAQKQVHLGTSQQVVTGIRLA